MKFTDFRWMTSATNNQYTVMWTSLERMLRADNATFGGADLDPIFQRGHVWSLDQRRAYVEYILRRGASAKDICFNCTGYSRGHTSRFVLMDGKQRLESVRMFMRHELAIFGGHYLKDFQGDIPTHAYFTFMVFEFDTDEAILQWYLDHNEGGVVHSKEELERVRGLLRSYENKHSL